MTITYNIPTQTVSLEIAPAEIKELAEDGRQRIAELFTQLAQRLKEQFIPMVAHGSH